VVVVAGSNYHVTTTWESGSSAGERLSRAVDRPGASLYVQLQRTIDAFAKADAARHHPGADTGQSKPGSPPSQGSASAPPSATSTPSPTNPSTAGSSGSGSGIGWIIALVVAAAVVTAATLAATRRARQRRHWQREAAADAHSQVEADLVKLGDDISALDIDSSMPNAGAEAKDEYSKAIDCYQEAERRLKSSDDAYQFAKGRETLARGQEHVRAAAAMFASGSAPLRTTPTSALDTTMADQLQRLASLHDRGDLTDEEFAEQKRQLIGD
jgi:hypothetical protein